jgi:hypothetical protein
VASRPATAGRLVYLGVRISAGAILLTREHLLHLRSWRLLDKLPERTREAIAALVMEKGW